jgi:hypothetical protein
VVKETIEVFFRLGPLHVNVVYEMKPGKWLVRCRLYDKFFKLPHEDVGVYIFILFYNPSSVITCSINNYIYICTGNRTRENFRFMMNNNSRPLYGSFNLCQHFEKGKKKCWHRLNRLIVIALMYIVFVPFDWTRALSPVCFWFVHNSMNFSIYQS